MPKRQLTTEQDAQEAFESQAIEGSNLTLDQIRDIIVRADECYQRELPIREALRRKAKEQGLSFVDLLWEYNWIANLPSRRSHFR